jgi:putative restriction endonuclease
LRSLEARRTILAVPLDLDYELRLAVFAHVRLLAERGGGRIPARLLNEGIVFRGERVPIWNQQKGIFRPAALRAFGAALSIQTSFDSPYDDEDDRVRDRLVYRYRGTDPDHPDNVALRRAGELRRPVLYLVAVEPGVYEPVFPCYVVGDRPDDLAFELVTDVAAADPMPDADPLANLGLKAYATVAAKRRLHQERFRYSVLAAYRRQCAMCRLRHVPLLDAAHILPDREERSLPEVPNGLSLCKIHHSAYDVHILGVDPDYRVHVRADVLEEHDGPMLEHGLQEMHGTRIHLPHRPAWRPKREYLAERFERFRAA